MPQWLGRTEHIWRGGATWNPGLQHPCFIYNFRSLLFSLWLLSVVFNCIWSPCMGRSHVVHLMLHVCGKPIEAMTVAACHSQVTVGCLLDPCCTLALIHYIPETSCHCLSAYCDGHASFVSSYWAIVTMAIVSELNCTCTLRQVCINIHKKHSKQPCLGIFNGLCWTLGRVAPKCKRH